MFELFGHIRAANPRTTVTKRKVAPGSRQRLHHLDLGGHLVILGGTDWNTMTMELLDLRQPELPVRQVSLAGDLGHSYFEVLVEGHAKRHSPVFSGDGSLVSDVGLFYRTPNLFNRDLTVTICSGLFSQGTFGVARTLTDPSLREGNERFLANQFRATESYGVLMRINVLGGRVATPDWRDPSTILAVWPDGSATGS